jgi:biotin carboxyl carrier protein
MTFDVEVAGRVRRVRVESAGENRFTVVLDGQPHAVDAVRLDEKGLSLLLADRHRSVEAQIVPGDAPGEKLVWLDGVTATATADGRRKRRGGGPGAPRDNGDRRILAPMPGRVVRVLVGPGDDVEARQPVLVIEAMKMENELRSPRAGRVKDVAVEQGASVEAGRVLVVIE